MTSAIISASAAILGTIIGVCVTLVIHRIDRKSNERKIINESIHYLLEVYYQVTCLNSEKIANEYLNEYMDYYFQKIRKTIPEADDKLFETLKEQIPPTIKAYLVQDTKQPFEELKDLSKQYESMVANLATILPIDAYYLRGKNSLDKLIMSISNYFEKIKIANINIEDINILKDIINKMQPSIINDIINDYIEDLKSELQNLLKKTDCYNRCAGEKVIEKIESEKLSEEERYKLDLFVDNIANMIISTIEQLEAQ